MNDFSSLLQQGNARLFVPSAILLGALHGLEPGHSKTMMAAFIVAIRGTLKQAVLLGCPQRCLIRRSSGSLRWRDYGLVGDGMQILLSPGFS
ncbi:hypothetical protein K9J44_08945 [Enterobacter hormaechei]|nr:hypothetical protein [Enterobacter hormaechei]